MKGSVLKQHNYKWKYTNNLFFINLHFIILGYVIIGHNAKAVTILDKVIIKIKNAFTPSLIKVMLTWIKNC
jgi:hypothetical protein